MSQVRVHNFSISLDGFGTGEGLTFDAPFGHAVWVPRTSSTSRHQAILVNHAAQ